MSKFLPLLLAMLSCTKAHSATICSCTETVTLTPVGLVGPLFFNSSSGFSLTENADFTEAIVFHQIGSPSRVYLSTLISKFDAVHLFGRISSAHPWTEIPITAIDPIEPGEHSAYTDSWEFDFPNVPSELTQTYLETGLENGETIFFSNQPLSSIPEPTSASLLLLSVSIFFKRRRSS